jgi:hypothetical protein
MHKTAHIADPELAIWERVFVPDERRITPELARYLLEVRFSDDDLRRIKELSAKADDGALNAQEKIELERYVHVGHLLSILKAKIRGKLKTKTAGVS